MTLSDVQGYFTHAKSFRMMFIAAVFLVAASARSVCDSCVSCFISLLLLAKTVYFNKFVGHT